MRINHDPAQPLWKLHPQTDANMSARLFVPQ
jgi:hypothetical protein